MAEEIDPGVWAASFVRENIATLYEIGKDILKGAKEEISLQLENTYKNYLVDARQKYSKTKSFFIRNESIDLYDFYVPTSIESDKLTLDEPNYLNMNEASKRSVVTGTGGCGKSVLMKHIFLSSIYCKKQIPIFIELRDLNSRDIGLSGLINETLAYHKFNFDTTYIEKAIKKGHFIFILDGFDEISRNLRNPLLKEIKKLSSLGPECSIIISSRPDDVFSGLDEFLIYKVQDLNLDRACELVGKLPFDHLIKDKFILELRNGMYARHRSFLSNPLLLSIMLLTYGQNAEIPTKLTIFYNQAYEALFQRHDAIKGGYKRERGTNLDIQDFSKVFSVFCLQTYDKRLFSLSSSDALDYIGKAKKHLNMDFNNEEYLKDALRATCLLIEDGLQIVFSHRSFQEYFVALYISRAQPEVQKRLIKKYSKNIQSDNVIALTYEMNQELIEKDLFIPELTKFFDSIGVKNKIGITHFTKSIKKSYKTINFEASQYLSATLPVASPNSTRHVEILHFANNCSGVQRGAPDNYEEAKNALFKKHGSPNKKIEYETSELTYKSQLMKDFSNYNYGFLSIEFLKDTFEYLKLIRKKHENTELSLDELLNV